MVRAEVFFPVRHNVRQAVGIGRKNVDAHDIFNAETGIVEDGDGVLPNLIVLRFKTFGQGAVGRSADLAGGNQSARIGGHFHRMAVYAPWWRDGRWIAGGQHVGSPPPEHGLRKTGSH